MSDKINIDPEGPNITASLAQFFMPNISAESKTSIPGELNNMAVVENRVALLGSASWNGAAEYKAGSEFHERVAAFFATFGGTPSCRSLRAFGIVYPASLRRNPRSVTSMVQQIVFEDEICWVARLRLRQLKAVFDSREALDSASTFKVEIGSMKFLEYIIFGLP
ncbi:hypothetical protein B7494_g3919 [Chlorociboria aeruginascens]|nr:hypothetical protein B7494_g3919 [Chlorociboria aeruginascens]